MKASIRDEQHYWITSLSKKDIMLYDLGVKIKSFTSINLLDKKHYPYLSLDMINNSESTGYLFKYKSIIKHRKFEPIIEDNKVAIDKTAAIPTRQHSIIEIKEEAYDELNIVNEDDILADISDYQKDTK